MECEPELQSKPAANTEQSDSQSSVLVLNNDDDELMNCENESSQVKTADPESIEGPVKMAPLASEIKQNSLKPTRSDSRQKLQSKAAKQAKMTDFFKPK